MLAGAGEWWLFGAWGRWYRCGLDGYWHPCPPPIDPAARRVTGPAPPGAGSPPVPSPLIPTGPDLAADRVTSTAFLGRPPETAVVARLQQALITALSVDPAQFALHDGVFARGTPSTVAAAWGALLWCAGAPVVPDEHPSIELFVPYLTVPGDVLRWMTPPDLSQLTAYYFDRLAARDGVGASHLVRVMNEVATGLCGDARFRPGAEALAAITAATLPLVAHDMAAAARFGPAAIIQEWRRRCPGEYAIPMLRDGAPGEYLRLCLYDLTEIITGLYGRQLSHADARRAGVAVLAADLQGMPPAVHAVLPWLDPDGARTLHAVLSQPEHPLRELWPREGRLPGVLSTDEAEQLHALLATAYTGALTACRLARISPPAPGFAIPEAVAAELTSPALRTPRAPDELTPWQIIEAARAHLAAESGARPPHSPDPTAGPATDATAGTAADAAAGSATDAEFAPAGDDHLHPPPAAHRATPPPPPAAHDAAPSPPPAAHHAAPSPPPPPRAQVPEPGQESAEPEPEGRVPGAAAPDVGVRIVEAYGTRFLCGVDDIDQLLTEVRRRAIWAKRLRGWGGQEVSSASAPALLLLGAASCGQRRLARMVGGALVDAGASSGEVRTMHAPDLCERGPEGVRAALDEHAGHTLLLDRLDALIIDDPDGAPYAEALYRARVEGVSHTTLVVTCGADRLAQLSATSPELVADLRAVRLPDLADTSLRIALLGLLAEERRTSLSAEAWAVASADLARLHGRGRLTNARLIEVYLDRACTNQLSRTGDTQAIANSSGLVLTPTDLDGIVADLSG
jgi:hypothetical protein